MTAFRSAFEALLGHPPNRWQERLHTDWFAKGAVPAALDLPTGLGKTSVMALWFIGRAMGAALPRRLVYVVDRRAVVDQATALAERLANQVSPLSPEVARADVLAVSTLRGRHADNRRWLDDPTASAIIVGTIDMIGSRLLFEGYGVSPGMRPFQAGLLGADSLFVLDEAHLCPPFEALLARIAGGSAPGGDLGGTEAGAAASPLRVLPLSATGSFDGESVFRLTQDDHDAWTTGRLSAQKRLTLVEAEGKTLVAPLAEAAWALHERDPAARVLVFCHSREEALKIADALRARGGKAAPAVELLTGERRVHEREELQGRLAELGFLGTAAKRAGPAFLVATAAGEVGVDIDADHMVCDLVAAERMIQRLGRVNRSGGDGRVAHVNALVKADRDPAERARLEAPWLLLPAHDDGSRDASPQALAALRDRHPEVIVAASTPPPLRPPLDRATVDSWSLTALREHPGRPAPAPWLRGWVEEEEGPCATILWRRHLPWRAGAEPDPAEAESFFAAAPPHLWEELEAPLHRIRRVLSVRLKAARLPADTPAAMVLSPARAFKGAFTVGELSAIVKPKDRFLAPGDRIVVSSDLGGLAATGHLDEKADSGALPGCLDGGWGEDGLALVGVRVVPKGEPEPGDDWRLVRGFLLPRDGDEDRAPGLTVWTLRRPDADSRQGDPAIARKEQALSEHHRWTEDEARRLADALWSDAAPADRARWTRILTTAARLHDLGKDRPEWQAAMAAPRAGRPFAKTRGGGNPRLLAGYRHEFGSLGDAEGLPDTQGLSAEERDLVLHLVASHHGHARPCIPPFDPARPPSANDARAQQAALRFARLQRRLGPWGLAWWEALLRAADQRASRRLDREPVAVPEAVEEEA